MNGRREGEPILEFIGRNVAEMRGEVREMSEKLQDHSLEDASRHADFLVGYTEMKAAKDDHGRRLASLEEAAEITGVHNADELREKYVEAKKELARAGDLRNRWILAIVTGSGALAALGHKLGWL